MDLKDQLRAALSTANGLYAKTARTEDEEKALRETLKHAAALREQIETGDQLKSLNDAAQQIAPDELSQKIGALDAILKRFQDEPALKHAGFVTVDGGNADRQIDSFADFLTAVRRNDTVRLKNHYKAALAEDSGATGGYTVPTQFRNDIMAVAAEMGVVRSNGATVVPMTGREVKIPALSQATAPSAGSTNFFGGMVATWVDEAGALTETEPTFEMVSLIPHKLGGYTLASNELMADSVAALEQLLKKMMGEAVAWFEDYAFLRGNGVGQPLGLQNSPALISVTRTAGSNDFDFADIALLERRLLPSSQGRAIWVFHPYLKTSIYALANTSTVSSWLGMLGQAAPQTLMGRKIVWSEKMVTAGTAFDAGLFDFSQYLIGDKGELSIAFSEHYRFVNDQAAWRFTHRVDGQPWLRGAITLTDASSTVSPFVALS